MSFKKILQEHNNAYWFIVGAGFIGAVALIFFQNEAFYRDFLTYARVPPPPPVAELRSARLTIDFGNGTKRAFEGESGTDMTILSALRLSGEAGGFESMTDARGQIVSVAGVRNSGGKRWRVYRNGTVAADLPGHIDVEPGDRITL